MGPTPLPGSGSRAGERTLAGGLERPGPAGRRRLGHGGRAELLGYLRWPPGPAAPLLLPVLPGVLPQLPSAFVALAHRCHLRRVASGLRTLHPLRGNGQSAPSRGPSRGLGFGRVFGVRGSSPDLLLLSRRAGTSWFRRWTAVKFLHLYFIPLMGGALRFHPAYF